MTLAVNLEKTRLDPADELEALMRDSEGDGAVVSFVGLARSAGQDGGSIDRLVLEDHPQLTAQSLEMIAAAGAEKFDVHCIRVSHRSGQLRPGEPIVFVGVSSRHRRAAFEAANYLMDRLKTEAIFWKREEAESGSRWIEPTEADYADRKRWE